MRRRYYAARWVMEEESRGFGARFICVTVTNLENIARGRYNGEAERWWVEKRSNFRGAA
jgi:hypothetical protein